MATSKNLRLLRTSISEAESLAYRTSNKEFPIVLRPIAERRKVTSVDFCPLLVDAMLTTHPGGFRILLNSDGGRTHELRERYNNESKGKLLHARLRFSIAHELAHTFFYDLSAASPKLSKKFTSGGGRTELENIERNCNIIAGHLLLPTPMLMAAFCQLKEVTADSIADLARTTGVSVPALLVRFAKSDSFFIKKYFRGCIALVDRQEGHYKIRTIAKPTSLNIANQLSVLSSGDPWDLISSDGNRINPFLLPSISTVRLDVFTKQTKKLAHYKISVARMGHLEASDSFLAVLEEIEY